MHNLELYFQKSELIPAIVQEKGTGEVLMLAYMNRESLQKTFETGYTWFYSRVRNYGIKARHRAIFKRWWTCAPIVTTTRCL